MSILFSLLGGSFGAAVIGLVQFLLNRHDKKAARDGAERKALRYIMLYIIQERGKELLARGKCTLEERRSLQHWHDVYHNGLGGNGDADDLMNRIMNLAIISN